jgi:hypothetical protein
MQQLDLFFEPTSASSSLSSSSLIGLQVQLPQQPCRSCGNATGVIGSSCGPHAHRISCEQCNAFCRWLSHSEADFIAAVSEKFGAPTSPIVIRGGCRG